MDNLKGKNFRRFGLVTVLAVYILIAVGSIVRSTGAGMGCPDWPRCFGQWIPPTNIKELPTDYKTRFQVAGKMIADFDAFKTWVEYVNRLVGVLIGFFIFITLILSTGYYKTDRPIFYLSLLAFLMVAFEGWLGSKVVATNLSPLLITLHMVVALLIVLVLIYAVFRSFQALPIYENIDSKGFINKILWLALCFSLLQIVLGTQVREAVDHISASLNYAFRETWVEKIGTFFYIHRSFSLLIFGLNLFLAYQIRKNTLLGSRLRLWGLGLLLMLFVEIASGAMLSYLAMPAFLQPIHLFLATLIFGVQFVMLLLINTHAKTSVEKI